MGKKISALVLSFGVVFIGIILYKDIQKNTFYLTLKENTTIQKKNGIKRIIDVDIDNYV